MNLQASMAEFRPDFYDYHVNIDRYWTAFGIIKKGNAKLGDYIAHISIKYNINNLWSVQNANAEHGYGALLYNIILDYVTFELHSWLACDDRGFTSNEAQNIYRIWYNDPNIEKEEYISASDNMQTNAFNSVPFKLFEEDFLRYKYRTKTSRYDLGKITYNAEMIF